MWTYFHTNQTLHDLFVFEHRRMLCNLLHVTLGTARSTVLGACPNVVCGSGTDGMHSGWPVSWLKCQTLLARKSPEMEPQPCPTAAERLRELRRNLQSARDEINRFAALSARKRRRGRPSTLPKRAKDIACIIHDIEYPSWKTAEEYLLRHMRARGVENHECIEAIRAELNSDYHGATVAELERWRTPTAPADQRKRTEAMRFVTELTLHGWLQMSNEVLGKAPTSAQVATKYATLAHGALGHEPEATGWTPSVAMTTKTRSFMKRWRRRWAVKYRKLPAGTTITDSEAGKKVLTQYGLVSSYTSTYLSRACRKTKPEEKQTEPGQFIVQLLAQI